MGLLRYWCCAECRDLQLTGSCPIFMEPQTLGDRELREPPFELQAMIVINRQDTQLAGEIRSMRELTAGRQELAVVKELEITGLSALWIVPARMLNRYLRYLFCSCAAK